MSQLSDGIMVDQLLDEEIPGAVQSEESLKTGGAVYGGDGMKPSADMQVSAITLVFIRALRFCRLNDFASRLNINRFCLQCSARDCPIESLCYCFGCGMTFHKTCWALERRHVPQPDLRVCSSPTDLSIDVWMRWLLEPNVTPQEQADSHAADVYSKWFGVVENRTGVPSLLVWPRLSQLILKYPPTATSDVRTRQYPSLISFFGDTGGGKSTLIKTLIRSSNPSAIWEAPVPGTRETSHYSTSGDVNLYIDPSSARGEAPMLYAGELINRMLKETSI